MDERIAANLRRWDEMAALHETTYFGENAIVNDEHLTPLELDELGDLTGQRVCHLQCHLGGDSLSLARLGATVVGVDFSPVAIEIARRRACEHDLADRVTFVCASIDDVIGRVDGSFDGVYTSWGVLCWLPSMDAWACTARDLIGDNGWLYIAETHPYAAGSRWPTYPYGGSVAFHDEDQGDYSDPDAVFEHPESWQWNHGIGEIVTAVATAGFTIEFVHEHPVCAWNLADSRLQRRSDGLWELPGSTLPLSFTLRAIKSSGARPRRRTPSG